METKVDSYREKVEKITEQNIEEKGFGFGATQPVDYLVLTLDNGKKLKFRKSSSDSSIPDNILKDYLDEKELEVEGEEETKMKREILYLMKKVPSEVKEEGTIKVEDRDKYKFLIWDLYGPPYYEYEQLR